MPTLKGHYEEVKKKNSSLTQIKLLIRLTVLLSQIKAGDNSYKLKN